MGGRLTPACPPPRPPWQCRLWRRTTQGTLRPLSPSTARPWISSCLPSAVSTWGSWARKGVAGRAAVPGFQRQPAIQICGRQGRGQIRNFMLLEILKALVWHRVPPPQTLVNPHFLQMRWIPRGRRRLRQRWVSGSPLKECLRDGGLPGLRGLALRTETSSPGKGAGQPQLPVTLQLGAVTEGRRENLEGGAGEWGGAGQPLLSPSPRTGGAVCVSGRGAQGHHLLQSGPAEAGNLCPGPAQRWARFLAWHPSCFPAACGGGHAGVAFLRPDKQAASHPEPPPLIPGMACDKPRLLAALEVAAAATAKVCTEHRVSG